MIDDYNKYKSAGMITIVILIFEIVLPYYIIRNDTEGVVYLYIGNGVLWSFILTCLFNKLNNKYVPNYNPLPLLVAQISIFVLLHTGAWNIANIYFLIKTKPTLHQVFIIYLGTLGLPIIILGMELLIVFTSARNCVVLGMTECLWFLRFYEYEPFLEYKKGLYLEQEGFGEIRNIDGVLV